LTAQLGGVGKRILSQGDHRKHRADEKEAVLKFTTVELTSKFRDDKTDKLFLQYHGKIVRWL